MSLDLFAYTIRCSVHRGIGELAGCAGMAEEELVSILAGEKVLMLDVAYALADCLGISMDELARLYGASRRGRAPKLACGQSCAHCAHETA